MSRLFLQALFEDILGSRNVYYQPPESVKMKYPAIVYSKSIVRNVSANNGVYNQFRGYEATVIDTNPDSPVAEAVSKLPKCRFVRHFIADNLHHDVFELYY